MGFTPHTLECPRGHESGLTMSAGLVPIQHGLAHPP